jgi:ribosomal-protein-alanine N-acetyltransferase
MSGETKVVMATARLLLRELQLDDLDHLAPILGDALAMRYYPHPLSRSESLQWILRNRARYAADGHGLWAVVLEETGELVGDCGLTVQTVEGVPELEVGYHIKRSHWRRGLATEAALACRDFAFTRLDRDRLISISSPGNTASQGVAKRLGMTFEKKVIYKDLPQVIFSMQRPAPHPR